MTKKENAPNLDLFNKGIWERKYSTTQLSFNTLDRVDYFYKMRKKRLELIYLFGKNKKVLEIGCGTGDFLFYSRHWIREGVGLDFLKKAIDEALNKKAAMNANNLTFVTENAKHTSFNDEEFDLIFSYSTLYSIPDVEEVILEIKRLLKKDGIAILDLGNFWSLNTIVNKAHTEIVITYHLKIREIKRLAKKIGIICDWKAYQILPLWGGRPNWLKPLLHPIWKNIMQKEIMGRMLDYWISNFPLFKRYAFRQILVCRKEN